MLAGRPDTEGEPTPMAISETPFIDRSDLPYQLPPFDKIKIDHYRPAFERGMAAERDEIEAIAANPQPPTFENTLVALERAGQLLERVAAVFDNLCSSDASPEIQRIEQDLAPQRAAHRDATYLDRRLYQRIHALYESRETLELDPESQWLLERYHTDFARAGAQLSDPDQQRLRELNQELSRLTTAFKNRLLADTNELAVEVEDPARLAGLSADAVAAAAQAGRERGHDGAHVLSLALPTNQPSLAALTDRALRERIHAASTSRGARGNAHDTSEVVRQLVALRAERARLLGYEHHAAYQIADRTAGTAEAAAGMLARLAPAAVANAEAEQRDLQQQVDAEGGGFALRAWDWAYYAERVRKQRYDLDTAALRPYLELGQVLHDGVFFAASELYGLRFVERTDLPVYHPQVRVFEVFDADGTEPDAGLGLFLADFYTRDSKRGGAWMSSFVRQSGLRGTRPVVVVNLNLNRPPDGEPTLLTVDEVRTLFHEFGHALHGLFSDVTYPRFSGTSVPRDFVEYPSQVNEVWMLWPEVLANYARHHRTGEPLPAGMVERLEAARTFNEGFATTEYLAASLLDLAWHQLTVEQAAAVTDVAGFEAEALAAAGVALPAVPPRYRSTYFAHIFSTDAYSAGYYSYIWSEVLDADTVEWFKDNGGLRRANGDWFRRQLLSRGGSIDSMAAFRAFRGRDPQIEPLLDRRGLRPDPAV
jgi:peptidyl-dipeptidase Dcp